MLIDLCYSGLIDEEPLRFRGEVYHGYHFNCSACGTELDATAREVKSRPGLAVNDMVSKWLYGIYVYFYMLIYIRVFNRTNCIVFAATIKWVFPFVVPVVDRLRNVLSLHWESTGMWSISCAPSVRSPSWVIGTTRSEAWPIVRRIIISSLEICVSFAIRSLEAMVCGEWAFILEQPTKTHFFPVVFTALNKAWCVHHFACSVCDTKMTQKSKFYEYDEKPVCKKCYERFPNELRRRLRTAHEMTMKKNVWRDLQCLPIESTPKRVKISKCLLP